MSNLYLDIHLIQNLPPSCVNRDDTGSPKNAVYGGVMRARVSSQCWKNAIRKRFCETIANDKTGIRTTHIFELLKTEIESLGGNPASELAMAILTLTNISLKEEKTAALFFVSKAQISSLAKLAVSNAEILMESSQNSKKEKKGKKGTGDKSAAIDNTLITKALTENPSIDIALFGRMVAGATDLKTDASCQVAHAISTHEVANEFDFYTAQDDFSKDDSTGAGMLGTVEFNSATLYRYATIAVHALKQNLGDDSGERTKEAIIHFVDAFIRSMPTGKLNTFANRTLPSAVMVTIREDQPINLVGAFEKPVKAGEDGYVEKSVNALADHAKAIYKDWLGNPAVSLVIGDGLEDIGERVSFKDMLAKLESEISSRL